MLTKPKSKLCYVSFELLQLACCNKVSTKMTVFPIKVIIHFGSLTSVIQQWTKWIYFQPFVTRVDTAILLDTIIWNTQCLELTHSADSQRILYHIPINSKDLVGLLRCACWSWMFYSENALVFFFSLHEPQCEKTYLLNVRPTKIQISLCIHAVWSESCPHEQTLHPWLSKMHPAKVLNRLSGCTGWS